MYGVISGVSKLVAANTRPSAPHPIPAHPPCTVEDRQHFQPWCRVCAHRPGYSVPVLPRAWGPVCFCHAYFLGQVLPAILETQLQVIPTVKMKMALTFAQRQNWAWKS